MGQADSTADGDKLTIRPRMGTGWETAAHPIERQILMRSKFLRLDLPVRRRISYSQVVRVASVCRESWWIRAFTPVSGSFGRGVTSGGGRPERTVMPSKGWRHDILVTLKGGKTIKVMTVGSPDTAEDLVKQLRQRLGLPDVY